MLQVCRLAQGTNTRMNLLIVCRHMHLVVGARQEGFRINAHRAFHGAGLWVMDRCTVHAQQALENGIDDALIRDNSHIRLR
mgnify:FL=1